MSRMEKKTTLKLSLITFKDAKDFIISEGKGIESFRRFLSGALAGIF